jgi:GTP-binding protein HflX
VGFIRELPKDLFAAFRSTFEEAADADLLVHVVDASDPAKDVHIRTTVDVLEELDLAEIPRILVYNKADLLEPMSAKLLRRRDPGAVLVSATHRESTRALIERIAESLADRWDASAKVPEVPLGAPEDAQPEEAALPRDVDEISTLESMLRAAGKRPRAVARRVQRE